MTGSVDPGTGGEVRLAPAVRYGQVRVDGAELAVVEVGDPQAPAVVLAHGALSSARFLCAAFEAAVVGAGGRLVAYDARGHAASGPARDPAAHHLDVHAADLAAVVRATPGPVAVVGGVSLGAHAAVRMLRHGVETPPAILACLPAWIGHAERGVGAHAVLAAEVARDGLGSVVRRLRDDPQLAPWLRATLMSDLPRHDEPSVLAVLQAMDGGEAPDDAELRAIGVPMVVLSWGDDPLHPSEVARRWSDVAPGVHAVELRLDDLDADIGVLGQTALSALTALRSGMFGR